MTHGGYGSGPADPFGGDPFGGDPFGGSPGGGSGYAASGFGAGGGPSHSNVPPLHSGLGSPPPPGEVNTAATLSIVFAVVFAPAGAALGHLALHQIRQRGERGRERAIIGLTSSYVIIVAAVIALVIWLLTASESSAGDVASTPATTTSTAAAAPPPPPVTTVITAPPTTRPTVQVEELSIGDCVEFTQERPIPDDPSKDFTTDYRTPCQARDGVFVVIALVGSEHECHTRYLFNGARTLFACLEDFRG